MINKFQQINWIKLKDIVNKLQIKRIIIKIMLIISYNSHRKDNRANKLNLLRKERNNKIKLILISM